MKYQGRKTREISFPLGGIGTGSIGLAGNGSLIDWEIFNRPSKGSVNGFSHIAIKAEAEGKLLDARVLNGDVYPPYSGQYGGDFGHGVRSEKMLGFPHFSAFDFQSEFPLAKLHFSDPHFPGKPSLLAFNPFIPLDDKDSSLPVAFFEIKIKNTLARPIDYTVCFSLRNPFYEKTTNRFWTKKGDAGLTLGSSAYDEEDPRFGEMSLASDGDSFSYQESWYRGGGWFGPQTIFWEDFAKAGPLPKRSYGDEGTGDMASLARRISLRPGEEGTIRFVVAWHFPNNYNYWNPLKEKSLQNGSERDVIWKNYYAALFANSLETATYALAHWDPLYQKSRLFQKALYSSSLPPVMLEAIGSNLCVLKSPTVLRLSDGSFYGWEGCHEKSGSCEGSCTHVWNYAYALPFLFPKLERSLRDLDYRYNQRDDGGMAFRQQLPLGRERWAFRPCVDGQFGGVMKVYRDWKICGDTSWLKSHWNQIKKAIDFAWSEANADGWDRNKDGVLEGRQHHTLDMELFGPSSWLEGFYLGALKAGAEMAQALGDLPAEKTYSTLFEKGKAWTEENLFNGSYYQQKVDLKNREILTRYEQADDAILNGEKSVSKAYWNEEKQEIEYQIGSGCEIDQVLAQWHANLSGLGEIFPANHVVSALKELYHDNFVTLRDVTNPCRLFAVNDEKGLLMCTWPNPSSKPAVPLPYAQECMTGFEYAEAALMIQEGMAKEATEIVEAIRDRYDGEKRNPYNEIECGSNYARSMASYSLLLAASGFSFDMTQKRIGFDPRCGKINQRCRYFFSLDSGWGIFEEKPNQATIRLLDGTLTLEEFTLPELGNQKVTVEKGKQRFLLTSHDGLLHFEKDILLEAGEKLILHFSAE